MSHIHSTFNTNLNNDCYYKLMIALLEDKRLNSIRNFSLVYDENQ